MNSRRLLGTACCVAHLLVACGSEGGGDEGGGGAGPDVAAGACDSATGVDVFSSNLTKTGPAGYEVALVSADPAPPAQAANTWTLSVKDADGAPLAGATVEVVPWMPEHGHGANVTPAVEDLGDGTYTVSRVTFIMPGVWETTVTVSTTDGETDEVVFAFCIE